MLVPQRQSALTEQAARAPKRKPLASTSAGVAIFLKAAQRAQALSWLDCIEAGRTYGEVEF
jgi:hypothetical protein